MRSRVAVALIWLALAPACATPILQLPLFGDRTCSRVPDMALSPRCCMEHDIDYGTGAIPRWVAEANIPCWRKVALARAIADIKFYSCNLADGVAPSRARAALEAVRAFGAESFNARCDPGPDAGTPASLSCSAGA